MSATAPGKHWGTTGLSQEEDGVRDHQTSQISISSVCALAGGEDPEADWLYFLLPGLPLTPRAGVRGLQQELEHASSLACHMAMPPVAGTCVSHSNCQTEHFGTLKTEKTFLRFVAAMSR